MNFECVLSSSLELIYDFDDHKIGSDDDSNPDSDPDSDSDDGDAEDGIPKCGDVISWLMMGGMDYVTFDQRASRYIEALQNKQYLVTPYLVSDGTKKYIGITWTTHPVSHLSTHEKVESQIKKNGEERFRLHLREIRRSPHLKFYRYLQENQHSQWTITMLKAVVTDKWSKRRVQRMEQEAMDQYEAMGDDGLNMIRALRVNGDDVAKNEDDGWIYVIIQWPSNGELVFHYVGSTVDCDERWQGHLHTDPNDEFHIALRSNPESFKLVRIERVRARDAMKVGVLPTDYMLMKERLWIEALQPTFNQNLPIVIPTIDNTCDRCHYQFPRRAHLIEHKNSKMYKNGECAARRNGKDSYCMHCKQWMDEETLKKHNKRFHRDELKMFWCMYCDFNLEKKGSIQPGYWLDSGNGSNTHQLTKSHIRNKRIFINEHGVLTDADRPANHHWHSIHEGFVFKYIPNVDGEWKKYSDTYRRNHNE